MQLLARLVIRGILVKTDPKKTGSGAHPAFYPMAVRNSFPQGKAARMWSYTSIPQYAFKAWCSVKAQG